MADLLSTLAAVQRLTAARESVAVTGGGYFPVLVTLADGSLGAAVRGGAPHLGRAGRLDWLRSTDGGATWSEPMVIVDSEWDDRNPAVGVMPDGDVVCAYAECHAYRADGSYDPQAGPFLPMLTRSSDGGATWSAPAPLAPQDFDHGSPYGRIIVLPNGNALMPVYVWPGAEEEPARGVITRQRKRAATVLRSRDRGQTWWAATIVAEDHNECSLALTPDAHLLAVMRDEAGGLATSEAADGGRTWTQPRPLTPSGLHPADAISLGEGTVLVVCGCRLEPKGVLALLSDDGGFSFPVEKRAFLAWDALDIDCGYPSAQRLADGTIVVLWYAVGTSRLAGPQARALRFTEAELRAAFAR